MTNYERIKAMSIEEMAEFFAAFLAEYGAIPYSNTDELIEDTKAWLEEETEE